ncbi:MAG: hypothetical protein HC849_03475 [Oscillatoriales cyanobacterium RU_3_3]|nr:hypothetical protein [Microcoleus sp. SU_5_6]NJM59455.1 hypothetical protein [Oscillatoriales cyanobacterium RU_3_3]NJR21843.1 hypothetical protein [Richelia sp. CSU_2_1]
MKIAEYVENDRILARSLLYLCWGGFTLIHPGTTTEKSVSQAVSLDRTKNRHAPPQVRGRQMLASITMRAGSSGCIIPKHHVITAVLWPPNSNISIIVKY